MNKKMPFLRISLGLLFVVAVVLVLVNYLAGEHSRVDAADEVRTGYHLQIVTEKNSDNFWPDFKEGVEQAAADFGVSVEFVESDTRTTEDIVSLVKRGIYARVDGIAFRPTDTVECADVVSLAKESGVAVINFESEENILPLTGSVNSDYYQIGQEQGKLLLEASGGTGGAVIIVNEKDMQEGEALCNAEKIQGITENIVEGDGLEILAYYKVDPEMFQTEQVIMQVLEEYPQVRSIVCTDAWITQGVSEYLEQEGLSGQVQLIGYGNTPDIRERVQEGQIYGTVYADAKSIGYQVVRKLCEILDGTGREDIESVAAKVAKGETE